MAMIRIGVIRDFDSENYLADVELTGYQGTLLSAVPVAYHLRSDLVKAGTKCAVLFVDELNPTDGVVLALFGGKPAADPLFDPSMGHKHRGLEGDGPRIPAESIEW